MIEIEAKNQGVRNALNQLLQRSADLSPLNRAISVELSSQAEQNFESESGPSGKWKELKPATLKRRRGGGGKILRDSGRLAASVTPFSAPDEAGIGTNVIYAAIQHLGGTVERAPFSSWVRLRTDKKGNLLRQAVNDKLAVFAKASHKQAKTVRYTSERYGIGIPAREYLPVSGDGALQAGMEPRIMGLINDYLAGR